jgi:hypothetical protein
MGAFMPAPGSAEFDAILAPYSELQVIVEHSARRKRLAGARQAGELARRAAMGGHGLHGQRKRQSPLQAA